MKIDYSTRLAKLSELSQEDVIAFVPGANMVYFTGLHFHLSERPIVALQKGDELSFIIPGLEVLQLEQRPDLNARAFAWNDEDGYMGAFQEAVSELELEDATLAVDGKTMRVFEWLAFQLAESSLAVRDVGDDLLKIRARKTPEEIDLMRRAVHISEEALRHVIAWVKPGMTESAIAEKLCAELSIAGSEAIAFAIVLTGPNSALPHGTPGDRELGPDDLLLIDYGGMVNGYPADITRTFCFGSPAEELQKIHAIVLEANKAARAIAGPGVPCGEVDRAAREVIEKAGYGEYFTHRTGHGLGLEVHELPQIAQGVEEILEPGMVFTIEPGVYIPDLGGVRIEDDVAVTENGIEVLTSFPRRLETG